MFLRRPLKKAAQHYLGHASITNKWCEPRERDEAIAGGSPAVGRLGARWIGRARDKEALGTISLQERDESMTEKPQPGFALAGARRFHAQASAVSSCAHRHNQTAEALRVNDSHMEKPQPQDSTSDRG